jgi:hypothetical protein
MLQDSKIMKIFKGVEGTKRNNFPFGLAFKFSTNYFELKIPEIHQSSFLTRPSRI